MDWEWPGRRKMGKTFWKTGITAPASRIHEHAAPSASCGDAPLRRLTHASSSPRSPCTSSFTPRQTPTPSIIHPGRLESPNPPHPLLRTKVRTPLGPFSDLQTTGDSPVLRLRCAYAWGGGAGQQVVCYSGITKTRAVIGHPLTPPPGCSTASYVLLLGRRSLLTYTVMCNAGGPVAGERKVKKTHGREKEVSDVGLDRGGEGEGEKECGI